MSFCYDNEPTTVLCPDRKTELVRTPIRRSGYWVARYKGHYHQIHGGIRGPKFLSQIKHGKA